MGLLYTHVRVLLVAGGVYAVTTQSKAPGFPACRFFHGEAVDPLRRVLIVDGGF